MSQFFSRDTQQVGARFQRIARSVPYCGRVERQLPSAFDRECHIETSVPVIRLEWSDTLCMRYGEGWLELREVHSSCSHMQ